MKTVRLLFAVALLGAGGALAKPTTKPKAPAGMAAAPFRLPPATYNSTPPVAIRDTTALRPTKPRGPVYLPIGAKNVALGKKVTSSDDSPIIGELKMLTDGDKNPCEKNPGEASWVELAPGRQWIQIDLGQAYSIHGVLFWHYYAQTGRVYRDIIVQVADDADFVENVRTVFNNDQDNSSGLGIGTDREFYEIYEGKWIPFEQKARFVRFYSKGNAHDQQNQYTEAEVWASPMKAAAKVAAKPKKVAAKTNKTPSQPPAPPGMMKAPFVLPPPTYN